MKIAIVADWLVTFGGAEHVLAELHELFPDAPLFTTVARPERLGPLKNADIRTIPRLQKLYTLLGQHELLLPLLPRALEELDLKGFDVVISSSHAVAKGIIVPSTAVHVCYCHTPMRYAWEMQEQYLNDFHVPHLLRKTVRRMLSRLRRWDLSTAKRTDTFLANSHTTQERIFRIYGRTSEVLPPPVHTHFFETPLQHPAADAPFFAIGRMVPYKRFDLIIAACNKLQLPLWIAGGGREEARLRQLAGPTVRFLGRVEDEHLPALYASSRALLFPQEEDAGMVLLEAQACGTPAIAFGKGGALDAVEEGKTGVLFHAQTTDSLEQALTKFQGMHFDRATIRHEAERFSQTHFRSKFMDAVERTISTFGRTE